MALKKLSIVLDSEVAEAATAAAAQSGQSLSEWLNDAARMRLRIERRLAAVAERERDHGGLVDECPEADSRLDVLTGQPLPPSVSPSRTPVR